MVVINSIALLGRIYNRINNLYKSGATTQQNYDSAKAQADATKAQYDLAHLQVDYTEVRAPVDQ